LIYSCLVITTFEHEDYLPESDVCAKLRMHQQKPNKLHNYQKIIEYYVLTELIN